MSSDSIDQNIKNTADHIEPILGITDEMSVSQLLMKNASLNFDVTSITAQIKKRSSFDKKKFAKLGSCEFQDHEPVCEIPRDLAKGVAVAK